MDPPTGHMRFPGTITIPEQAFEQVLEDAARSFKLHGFRDIVFIGDHGGYQKNEQAVAAAAESRVGGNARARACRYRVLPRNRDRSTSMPSSRAALPMTRSARTPASPTRR